MKVVNEKVRKTGDRMSCLLEFKYSELNKNNEILKLKSKNEKLLIELESYKRECKDLLSSVNKFLGKEYRQIDDACDALETHPSSMAVSEELDILMSSHPIK